jgi:hypothetical protein
MKAGPVFFFPRLCRGSIRRLALGVAAASMRPPAG